MKHDREVTAMFEARGWTVLRIWECELKKKNIPNLAEQINQTLNRSAPMVKKERL